MLYVPGKATTLPGTKMWPSWANQSYSHPLWDAIIAPNTKETVQDGLNPDGSSFPCEMVVLLNYLKGVLFHSICESPPIILL